MKILLANDSAMPAGGAQLATLALRDGLRQRGHDARLFASSARAGAGRSYADYVCLGTISRFRTLLQTVNPWAFKQFHRALTEFRPDVVHVGMFLTQLSPLILRLLKDVPSLYHAHWYRPICPTGKKMLPDGSPCQRRFGGVCYRSRCLPMRAWLPLMLQMKLWQRWHHVFDLIVAGSETVKRRLMAEGFEPVELVFYGVPIQPSRRPLSSPPTVAFAGRLAWVKGVDLLVRAFAEVVSQIPEARLILAGDGPEQQRLRGLINELRLSASVSMLGSLPRLEMERHLATAWVQVVPSRWAEPFGLVAAEAMMRGTAVIASTSGGLTEIVHDGLTGLLVPAGDVGRLEEALLRLLRDRDLAEQMGRAGRETAMAHFSEATFVDRFMRLYQTLWENRGNTDGS